MDHLETNCATLDRQPTYPCSTFLGSETTKGYIVRFTIEIFQSFSKEKPIFKKGHLYI